MSVIPEPPDWSRIPAPADDGAAAHLQGARFPALALPSTEGPPVDLSALPGRTVVYVYPMTAVPGRALPRGWDNIPGARGCTPQSCSFRDHFAELRAAGIDHLFGLSAQPLAEGAEAARRLHLPFPLLSDAAGALRRALALPSFTADGILCLHRMSWVIEQGSIRHCFHPVFPPDASAAQVLDWLRQQR